MKYWISIDGRQVGDGVSHQTSAIRALPPSVVTALQADYARDEFNEALYDAMFARKYMRVTTNRNISLPKDNVPASENTVFIDQPDTAKLEYLPKPQRDWVYDRMAAGCTISFNQQAYVETRMGRRNADEIVEKLVGS